MRSRGVGIPALGIGEYGATAWERGLGTKTICSVGIDRPSHTCHVPWGALAVGDTAGHRACGQDWAGAERQGGTFVSASVMPAPGLALPGGAGDPGWERERQKGLSLQGWAGEGECVSVPCRCELCVCILLCICVVGVPLRVCRVYIWVRMHVCVMQPCVCVCVCVCAHAHVCMWQF